ncbi:hypothetical protein ACFLQ5_01750 [Bacteroidota bacterium]
MRNNLFNILVFILVFTFFSRITAQEIDFEYRQKKKFFNYLIENKLYNDAIQHTKLFNFEDLRTKQKDSIFFFKGYSFYNLHQSDSSFYCFQNLSDSSSFCFQSKLLSYKSFIEENRFSDAKKVLLRFSPSTKTLSEITKLNLAGIALIERDYLEYEKQIRSLEILSSNTEYKVQNLDEKYSELLSVKKKSPFIAGTLSGIVPGLGKVYAGKPKQGLSSFLAVTTFGVQAFEYYKKKGLKSSGFYVFGTLFTVFYIGNIWGSALSVKIVQDEYDYEINNKILLDIRIPVESIIK